MKPAFIAVAGGLLLLLARAAPVAGQVTVQVRVVAGATGAPIDGAALRLGEDLTGITDDRGEHRFTRVLPGAWTLTVQRIGFRTRELVLRVASDTTIVVIMADLAIPIDTLVARRESFTLSGEVIAEDDEHALPDADVTIGERETVTNGAGRFRFRNVTAGEAVTLSIGAPGYIPVNITLTAARDTTLRIRLQPDPVGQQMIAQQVQRIQRRMRAAPVASRAFTRADLLRHGAASVGEALRLLGGPPRGRNSGIRCVIIDERPWYDGPQILDHFTPEQIDRVEYVGSTLRVYTVGFVRRQMAGRRMLVQIVQNVCQ